jgi:nucleoside-diphosphate-sugar epimerase
MRLTIFGATGGTGQQLVLQALAADHEVAAFARDPSRLTQRHERLTVVPGDLADQAAVERAIAGASAVISVLGPRRDAQGKPITRGTQCILAAMQKLGVRRLVVSSTPSARDPTDSPDIRFKLAVGVIRRLAPGAYEDIVHTAEAVRASDRDWTIVRVSMLSDGAKTARVMAGPVNRDMRMRLTRADLAEFMLKQVRDMTYLRQAPAIGTRRE